MGRAGRGGGVRIRSGGFRSGRSSGGFSGAGRSGRSSHRGSSGGFGWRPRGSTVIISNRSWGGGGYRGGCGLRLLPAIFITIFILAMIGMAWEMMVQESGSSVTASTTEREALPAGSVEETGYYTDELGWISNPSALTSGMRSFYEETGVQPYLYITDDNGAYLSANGDWWRGTEQPISQIALVDAKDTETEQYLFNSYEIHVYTADLTSGTAALTGSLSWVDAPTAVMQFVGVNVSRPLLSDAAVRRALSVGIDRATVVTGYLSGHAEAASFPVSPRSTLYPEELEESYSATAYSTALEQAGLRAGEQQTLRLLVNADSEEKVSIANYMAQTWSHYDLQVIVEALPWEEYLAALAAGNFDLYYGEVKLRSDWDVPELIGTNGALNYGGYTAEETDALLAAFRTSGSRQPAAEALYAHLTQSCPILPVCFKNISVLTHRGMIEGMAPTAANIFYRMEDWQIAVAETAE